MAKQKEKAVEELLRQTKKLIECRPSCVIEGKVKMRGPGRDDPSDDETRMKVCESCGCPVIDNDFQLCGDRESHISCLEHPNSKSSADLVCCQCQSTSSGVQEAKEASLNSSSVISGEKTMTCLLSAQLGSQDLPSIGAVISLYQNNLCQVSKSAENVDEDVKKRDQSERARPEEKEGTSGTMSEETRKSDLVSGESSEQAPVLESVRRSKRGRPYKPVGGLHPNKRRSVDKSKKLTDRVPQAPSKLVIDEEDELGAKIEKFRVISSIDEKNLMKGISSWDESKDTRTEKDLIWDEKELSADAKQSTDVDDEKMSESIKELPGKHIGVVDSPIATDSRNLNDSNVSCGAFVESVSAVLAFVQENKISADVGKTLHLGSSDSEERPTKSLPLVPQSNIDLGSGTDHSVARSLSDCQKRGPEETKGIEHTQEILFGKDQEKTGVFLSELDPKKKMHATNSKENLFVTNHKADTMRSLHPVSNHLERENSGSSMQVVLDSESILGAAFCSKEADGKVEPLEDSPGIPGHKDLRVLVEQRELAVGERDPDNVSKPIVSEEAIQEIHCKETNSVHQPGMEIDVNASSQSRHSAKFTTEVTPFGNIEESLGECASEALPGILVGAEELTTVNPTACNVGPQFGIIAATQMVQAHCAPLDGNVGRSSVKDSSCPTEAQQSYPSALSSSQQGDGLIQPILSLPKVITPPFSLVATPSNTVSCPPHSSPTSVLRSKIQPDDIAPGGEVRQASTSGFSETPSVNGGDVFSPISVDALATLEEPNTNTIVGLQCTIEAKPEGSTVSMLEGISIDVRSGICSEPDLDIVDLKDLGSSSCVRLDLDDRVNSPQENVSVPLLTNEQQNISLSCENPLQPGHSELATADKVGEMVPCSLGSPKVSSGPGDVARSSDEVPREVCEDEQPGASKNSSSEGKLGVRSSQSISLEEEEDVKVCDICGDAGYEECLAVCSACSEGAEHIYCMQALLYAVPEDGWLCEGCTSKEKAGNLKEVVGRPSHHVTVVPDRIQRKKKVLKGNTRSRLSACIDKGMGSPLRKGATKGPLNHQLSAKRSADESRTAPTAKRQALESSGVSYSAPITKRQPLESTGVPLTVPIVKKQAMDSTVVPLTLPAPKKQALETTGLSLTVPAAKKQALENSGLQVKKQATESSSVPAKKQVLESSGLPSTLTAKKQAFESTSSPASTSKKQALDSTSLPSTAKKQASESTGLPATAKKQASESTGLPATAKKQALESTGLPSIAKKQTLETAGLPASTARKPALESTVLPTSAAKKPTLESTVLPTSNSKKQSLETTGVPSTAKKQAVENTGVPLTTSTAKKQALDSTPLTGPTAKKQVFESTGLSLNGTPRLLTKENSFRTPDTGKVKFLSQNALASTPVGGGFRNAGKSSNSLGLFSHSPRPGQAAQVANKNRYVAATSLPSDSMAGVTPTATKPPILTPRPSSLYGTPLSTPMAVRGPGSIRSSEPATLRSSSIPSKPMKDGSSEGNGSQLIVRDSSISCQLAAGTAKGWGAGHAAVKLLDIPRTMQSAGFPSQTSQLKIDSVGSSQQLEDTVIPSKGPVLQKTSQTSDVGRNLNNLTRFQSINRVSNVQTSKIEALLNQDCQGFKGTTRQSNSQTSRVEAQLTQELQGTKGIGKDLKSSETSAAVASAITSMSSPGNSQNSSSLQGVSQESKVLVDFSKMEALHPPGTVVADGQRNFAGASHSDDLFLASKALMKVPTSKPLDIAARTTKEMTFSGKDPKTTETLDKSWLSPKYITSMQARCYKCKEIGHTAQACSGRIMASSIATDLAISVSETPSVIKSPQEILMSSTSPPVWLGSIANLKQSISSGDLVPSSKQNREFVDSISISDTRLAWNKIAVSSSNEVCVKVSDDPRRQVQTAMFGNLLNGEPPVQLGILGSHGGEPPALTSFCGMQTGMFGKPHTPVTASLGNPSCKQTSVPMPVSQVRHVEDGPREDVSTGAASRDAKQLDSGITSIQDVQSRNSNEIVQPFSRGILSRPNNSPIPYVVSRPLEPPFPSQMMMLQSKTPLSWNQITPPLPILDRMVNQDMRTVRGGGTSGNGVGVSVPYLSSSTGSPSIRVSQCLWRGGFEVVSAAALPALYDGLEGYSSTFAAAKVRAVTKTLPLRLQLEEVRRLYNADAWPKQFQQKPPTDTEIALYFFPDGNSNAKFEEGYTRLLEHMMANDLVLMGQVEGAEILIFPSRLLPIDSQFWKKKMFLWGVYRARKSYPTATATPIDAAHTSADSYPIAMGSDQVEKLPSKVILGQGQKAINSGTPLETAPVSGDAAEVDMEIDMIGDNELIVQHRSARKSGLHSSPVGHPGFKPASSCPPGFEKVMEETLPTEPEVITIGVPLKGRMSSPDIQQSANDLVQGLRESNNLGCVRPSANSRQASPVLAPSPSQRDLPDDSAVGTSNAAAATHRHSHSSSGSPRKLTGKRYDRSGSRVNFYERESRKDRDWNWEKERQKSRDRERDKDREIRLEREERPRERAHDRESERKERSSTRSRDKDRGHRNKDCEKKSDVKCQHARSRSQSHSWSQSYSASRRRHQSTSVSPTRKPSLHKRHSRHRSRSYSISSDSNTGSLSTKPLSSEQQMGNRDALREIEADNQNRDGKIDGNTISQDGTLGKSRVLVFECESSKQETGAPKKDRVSGHNLNEVPIPFYNIMDQAGEERMEDCVNDSDQGSAPQYHLFLPAESGDAQMLETDTVDDEAAQPFFPKIWPSSPSARANISIGVSKQAGLEIYQSSRTWDVENRDDCSGYEFFPVHSGNVHKRAPSRNPNLDLALGENDRRSPQNLGPMPFFVQHMDMTGYSPNPCHRYSNSMGHHTSSRFPGGPITAGLKQKSGTSEPNSLNLTLSVPQYRKEGNMWVKVEDSEGLIGEEDVDFALSLGSR